MNDVACTEAKKQAHVDSELENALKTSEYLVDRANLLSERLSGILRDEPSPNDPETEKERYLVPTAQRVRAARTNVVNASDILDDIIDRLEL